MKATISQTEAARLLGLSERTLERYRHEQRGPRWRQLGRRVVYTEKDLEAWLTRCRRPVAAGADDDDPAPAPKHRDAGQS